VCIYACVCVLMRVYVCEAERARESVCMCVRVYMRARVRVHVCVCFDVRMCLYVRVHLQEAGCRDKRKLSINATHTATLIAHTCRQQDARASEGHSQQD
jgi:hypothetical protein